MTSRVVGVLQVQDMLMSDTTDVFLYLPVKTVIEWFLFFHTVICKQTV